MVETVAAPAATRFQTVSGKASPVRALASIEAKGSSRFATGVEEFDRVLGGGLVPGGVILLGGDPGIGKSTLLLQAMAAIGAAKSALYVTGEESAEQVALRAQRLGLVNAPVSLLAEVQLEAIIATIGSTSPEVVVIDSIQTAYTEALTSAPGSVAAGSRVRRAAHAPRQAARHRRHFRRSRDQGGCDRRSARAGAHRRHRSLFRGRPHSSFRLVRAIKNRFGAANELGVFAMTERGLKGVANPSALFLSQHALSVPGTAIVATLEGTRPLLVEIQALVDPIQGGNPRRLSVGLDPQRLALLLAVLHRHGGVETGGYDVFVNAVGGVRINEPAADLAILLAIHSSLTGRPLPAKTLVFGEVGLAGEIRPVQRGQDRIREAAKLGFRQFLIPTLNKPKQLIENTKIISAERVEQALQMVRE